VYGRRAALDETENREILKAVRDPICSTRSGLSRFLFIFSITPNVCLEPKVCARSAPFGGRSGLNKVGSLVRYPGGKAKLLKPILFHWCPAKFSRSAISPDLSE
jgi:hypothetical protein